MLEARLPITALASSLVLGAMFGCGTEASPALEDGKGALAAPASNAEMLVNPEFVDPLCPAPGDGWRACFCKVEYAHCRR